jgi:hypothetical protein
MYDAVTCLRLHQRRVWPGRLLEDTLFACGMLLPLLRGFILMAMLVLALVPTDRRDTLIPRRDQGNGNAVYRFDIRLLGKNETVFFDI